MNLKNLTQEQTIKLKEIAESMHISLEDLVKEHSDINTLIETYEKKQFGMLNE